MIEENLKKEGIHLSDEYFGIAHIQEIIEKDVLGGHEEKPEA